MQEDLFKKRYDGLNAAQRDAVDTIEGPVMVIAGPGTGKTTVLTLRIANILRRTDTPPDGILALTFTESAVASMRRKLVQLIGPGAYRVGIFTFHGFAEEVIRKFPESFPRIIGGNVATEAEKLSIIEEAIDTGEFSLIRPFGSPYHYVRGALHTISDLKRDAVTPEGFFDVLARETELILSRDDLKHEKGAYKGEMKAIYKDALKNIEKNRELGRLYEMYEGALAERNLYDFDDMLLELLKAFKDENLLQSLREEYLYFLADEHQDANNAQNKILEELSGYFESPNLFIVGDEKQAIYRFQGASLENFLYFKKRFPTAKLIHLDENYRSHQSILDVSHKLAEVLPGDPALRPRLLSKGGNERGVIEVISYPNENDEAIGIVQCVKDEIERGTAPEDIAVLVRTNREITEVGRFLTAAALPVTLFQDEDVLADPDVAKLFLLLRAINEPENETLLAEVLFIDFIGINPIEAIKAIRRARDEKKSMLDMVTEFKDFSKLFSSWVTLAKNRTALEVITTILSDSRFTEHLLKLPNSLEKMALLSALYQEIATRQSQKKDMTLGDFLEDIDTLKEHGARLTFSSRLPKEHSVSVMTAHRSKGMEWKVVFIPHVVSGHWGNKRSISNFRLPYPLGSAHQSGKEEDERRLFYVALTRAKERIVITHAHLGMDGKELVPSQFIEELPNELIAAKTGESAGETAVLLGTLASHAADEQTLWDQEYLRQAFLEQGMNATALNNYLECPWKYFFKNLIRVPELMEKHQMYGTAVHAALSYATNALRGGKDIDFDDIFDAFLKCLNRQPMSRDDYEESREKGERVLKHFWECEKDVWHKNALSEFNIAGVSIELPGGEQLVLRGRLDKIDLLDEKHVRVVDFKTGRPKTRNEILGVTKSSLGTEKRQLDFYRLLLELYDNGKYEMESGMILFTEPDEKGRIKKEAFDINHEDAEKVREEVIRVAGEIINFTFWSNDCKDKDCEFCNLRKILVS